MTMILQHDLRVRIDRILTLSVKRNEIANDVELDPVMKEGMLFVLEYEIRSQTKDLPDLQGLIETWKSHAYFSVPSTEGI